MQDAGTITLMTGRTYTEFEVDAIHYITMERNYADIHLDWGEVIRARVTMTELENALGNRFIKVNRSCLVAADRIHHISSVIVLNSGERIAFAKRQKAAVVARLCALRGVTSDSFLRGVPRSLGSKNTKSAPAAEPAPEPIPTAQQEEPSKEEPIQEQALQEEPIQEQALQEEPIQEQALQEEPIQEEPPQEESPQEKPVRKKSIRKKIVRVERSQDSFMLDEPLEEYCVPVTVNRRTRLLPAANILYIYSQKGLAFIHTRDGEICKTRTAMYLIEEALGDDFIRTSRAYLVAVMAIRSVADVVYLYNGEELPCSPSQRTKIRRLLSEKKKRFIERLSDDTTPKTEEAYREYYSGFERLPFAFADIEMVFNEELRAVDWIFRYGNPALARLEKTPLKKLIGKSFGSVFSNMDSKWLLSYEQAVIYGKTLEIMDYSPEIDTNLKIICFPTFGGHCGCILFDLNRIRLSENSGFHQVLEYYQRMLLT